MVTDDAHGAGSSTLIPDDAVSDIPQDQADQFLSEAARNPTKNNTTATVDPVVTDDDTSVAPGPYTIGSRWLNTATGTWFTCLDATTGAAVWKQDTNSAQIQQAEKEAPKEHFFGNLMHYPSSGGMAADLVQYVRVWLTAGLSFDKMRVFQDSGGNPARDFRAGIYDQAAPTDDQGVPDSKVAETGLTATAGANDGTFVDAALTSTFDVTTTGYYWLALVNSTASIKFAVSTVNRAAYLPRREQTGPGATALPATAGGFSNPTSAVALVSAVEV